jgi:hypothetical protein
MGFLDEIKTAFGDRRVQMGGAAVLSAIALLSVGALAVAASAKPEPQPLELADRAGLSVELKPVQRDAPPPQGRLATLDPAQIAAAQPQPAEPVDPALQAILDQQARETRQALAEQRAFDARLRAELADTEPKAPTEAPAPPVQRGGSTSNSEDIADQVVQAPA